MVILETSTMHLRKIVALLAVGAALAAGPALAVSVNEFCDLDPNHWAYPAVKELVEKYKIMEGYPGGCPEDARKRRLQAPPAANKRPALRKAAPAPRPSPAAAAPANGR